LPPFGRRRFPWTSFLPTSGRRLAAVCRIFEENSVLPNLLKKPDFFFQIILGRFVASSFNITRLKITLGRSLAPLMRSVAAFFNPEQNNMFFSGQSGIFSRKVDQIRIFIVFSFPFAS
jgi:hypothetical protein